MQKGPNSETKVNGNRDAWSFHSMVEYGKVTRDQHKRNLHESQEREKASCSFTPVLTAKKKTNERPLDKDRGVHMYQKAILTGSRLLAKNRTDKDPLVVDIEKYGSECSFKPRTNSNTNFSQVFKEERAVAKAELSQSPNRRPPMQQASPNPHMTFGTPGSNNLRPQSAKNGNLSSQKS